TTTTTWRASACTGISSTSSGSSSSRCSTSSDDTDDGHMTSAHVVPLRVYLLVFVSLLLLTATTVAAAFVDLGALNNVVAMAIAGLKATLVILFFMHVRYSTRLTPLVIVSGLF